MADTRIHHDTDDERNPSSSTTNSDGKPAGVDRPSAPEVVKPARPAYTGTAVLGLVLAAAGALTYFVAGGIAGLDAGDGMFFVIVAAIALVGAGLVWRLSLFGKIAGIVASLAVAAALFWTVFGLAYPSSFVDFVPGVLVPVGVLLGLGGSIAALVARRRGNPAPAAGERRIRLTALGLVGVAVVVSGLMTQLNRESVDAAVAEGGLEVTMRDFDYQQDPLEVAAGEATTLVVHNSDPVVHTFTIAELGINRTVLPGSDAAIDLEVDEPGTYTIYCVPHSAGPDADPTDIDEMAAVLEVTG